MTLLTQRGCRSAPCRACGLVTRQWPQTRGRRCCTTWTGSTTGPALGLAAAHAVLQWLAGEQPILPLFSTELVLRDSTGPAWQERMSHDNR